MSLRKLNTQQLHQHLVGLVKSERKILYDILLAIKEIEQRKSYQLHYANLFLYLTLEIGYSNGSAQRRIDGAKLLMEVPEVGEKIKNGEITLNQITLVQQASREVYRSSSRRVSAQEKAEILERINNKEFYESQRDVAAFFDLPVIEKTKIIAQADDSFLVEFRLNRSLKEKIEYAQSLLSHALPTRELVAYVEYLTDRIIKEKTTVRPAKKKKLVVEEEVPRGSDTDLKLSEKLAEDNAEENVAENKNFSARQRKILMKEQCSCQHVDPLTQKACTNTWFLQADHKQSRWAGGKSKIQNGQMLCAAHNQAKYRREAGIHPP